MAQQEGEPAIVVLCVAGHEADQRKFSFPVGPGEDIVGRDESCSIQVTDAQISRRQMSIKYDMGAGGFVASELGSTNGTFINGTRLADPVVLSEGDVIEMGDSRLVFSSKRFRDQTTAMLHFKRWGEHERGTLAGPMDES